MMIMSQALVLDCVRLALLDRASRMHLLALHFVAEHLRTQQQRSSVSIKNMNTSTNMNTSRIINQCYCSRQYRHFDLGLLLCLVCLLTKPQLHCISIEGDSSSEEQDQQMPVTPMNNAIHGPASSRRANTTTTNVSRMIDHVSAMKRLRRTPAIHNTAALPSPGFRLNRPISNIRSTINKGRRNLFRNSDQGLLQQLARINQSADGVSNQLIPTPFRNITATDSVTGNSMNREQPSTPLNEVEGGRDISNIQADSVRSNSGFNYQSTPGATTRNGDNSNNNNDSNYTNYNNTPSMMWTNQSAQSINDKSRISLLDSFGNSFDNSFDVNDMGFNTHAEHSILGNTMDSFSWTPTLKLDSDMNNDQSLFSTRQSLGNQSIFNNQSMFSPMLPQINSAVNGTDDNIENSNENNNDNSSNSVNENENDITDEPSFIIQASSYPEEGMDVQKDINASSNIDYSYNKTSSLHQQANVHLPPPLTLFNYDDDNNHSRNVTKSRRLRIPLSSIGLNRQQQSNPIAESAARPRQNRQSAKLAAYRVLQPSQTRSLFESFSTLAGSTLTESGLKSLENVTHEFIQYAGSELVNIMDKSSKRHSRTLTALPEHVYRLMSQQGLLSGNESSDIKSLAIQEAARVLPRELLNELDPVARITDEDLSH
ncbi:hypothetical protein GQ42DRAFT_39177 [Ramicandelaber brevisporus]|nr:hypothetical protein GQ42DRAFT_39177 [Ramicandelaber brevisporus]